MIDPTPGANNGKQKAINLALAAVAGQVGCLTLVVVLGSVLLGLWLDQQFQTRPVITLILVAVSVPISIVLMLVIVRGAVARIKTQVGSPSSQQKEASVGRNQNS